MGEASPVAVVSPPIDIGGGKKVYTVQGTKFEVDHRYDVCKPVGYGSYGLVCSGIDTITGERVAIKRISRIFEDLVDGKRVLREIKLLGFLRHDNILHLRDLMRPRDLEKFEDLYVVTDLLDTDLHQIIRSKQRLTDDHCQFFMYQAFRGLKYIHSANVLHRDLKPANFLATASCDLVICDFGLARGFDPGAMTDYVVTRWYRPPELLLLSDKYTSAIDCWSLGCILVELMNRRPLFPGKDYIHQINLITDVLGTLSEEQLANVKPEEAVRYLKSLPRKRKMSMSEVCPSASGPAVDFLSQLLVIDPDKRMTAKQALEHPYLSHLHDPMDEPECPKVFQWEYDSAEVSEHLLRRGFWDEIVKYHP
jgi:serine/threonine protein kinase